MHGTTALSHDDACVVMMRVYVSMRHLHPMRYASCMLTGVLMSMQSWLASMSSYAHTHTHSLEQVRHACTGCECGCMSWLTSCPTCTARPHSMRTSTTQHACRTCVSHVRERSTACVTMRMLFVSMYAQTAVELRLGVCLSLSLSLSSLFSRDELQVRVRLQS